MFNRVYKTVLEALRLEKSYPPILIFYKTLATVMTVLYMIVTGVEQMPDTINPVFGAVLLGFLSSALVFVLLPTLIFVSRFGWSWDTSDYYEDQKNWWNRMSHLSSPVVLRDHTFDYDPEKDAYNIGFYMSRKLVEDLEHLSETYDTDIAGLLDQSLGLLKLQDDARRMNTEVLLIATQNQALTERDKSPDKVDT